MAPLERAHACDLVTYAMPKIGDVIAEKYRLDTVAGEGGMGVVYAAEHLVLKQRVAVKVLLPGAATSEAIVERFAREARAAAKIVSEHVARVLDAGSLDSGAPFLVMEYLEGCDLEELSRRDARLPIRDVVDYALQALDGLAHAHAAGIVHRDLKPSNLFLAARADGTHAIKLLDFGISKTTKGKPEDKRLTGQHVLGSPVYMSPEQLRNATEIDARADLWSLGVVAYELLAGRPPFDGDGVGEIFAAILEQTPVPLCERNPAVPRELSDVIARCLRREPDQRWADAGELARALAPFSSEPAGPISTRSEQVLRRARQLERPKTPMEARLVAEAIDAAARRAREHGIRSTIDSAAALPLAKRKPAATPLRVVGAALAVTVLVLTATLAVRRTRVSAASVPVVAAVVPAPEEPSPAKEAEPAPAPPPAVTASATTATQARARVVPKSSAKPTRPKFLNSRD